jgi:hypothetical protein
VSPQDSLFGKWKKPLWLGRLISMFSPAEIEDSATKTGIYGPDVSLKKLAIDAIEQALREEYSNSDRPTPSPEQLRFLAEERYESSLRNGTDNYLGTAKRLPNNIN